MTDEKLFEDYYTEEQMARLLGCAVATLRNKISAGADLPKSLGRGKARRFPKAEFRKWETRQLDKKRA
jgi:predicted DNA-binding transcriptional regulator AlpA